jgi:hypothetical protein
MRRLLTSALLLAAAGSLGGSALAGTMSSVIPPAYEGSPGTGVFIGPHTNAQRTYQMLIHSSLLTDYVGRELSGFSWRLPVSATESWPAADTVYTNYDIRLSASVDPSARSLTFANNVAGPQTLVRSGPMEVPANAFPSGGSPNEFGLPIEFQNNYLYTGGHLLIEIRHTGNNSGSRAVDAITTSTSGYGTLFSGAWQSSYTAETGLNGNFTIIELHAVPEPASLALMGLAALALRRR